MPRRNNTRSRSCLVAAVCFLSFGAVSLAFAEDAMFKAKDLFLQHQYVQTIAECDRVIVHNPQNLEVLAEANYYSGASYVNLFDFLSAKKSFQVIIDKYKGTSYYEDAYLGLGDIELLQENLHEALKAYTAFYLTSPSKKRMATVYFRLAEVNLKLGNKDEFEKYYKKLQEEFPMSFEAKDSHRLLEHEDSYTVQVGAFTNYENAEKFIAQVKAKGYEVYSVLCMLSGKKLCRIRVGRCRTFQEAEELKKKLEADGYPAKIFPREGP